jgi:D-beta-D-heptose 7-phosphate kinase/D-beta-D-heptose 1-phosphate adenosyltransferase
METTSKHHPSTKKIVKDYESLNRAVRGLQAIQHKVVLTIGSWDLLHIGHVRYLLKAKSCGDFLVVGVDTDRAIKSYKGELRPVVPEDERCEMLSYQSCVDLITIIDDVDEKGNWQYSLIRLIQPDVFVAVEGSYPEEQLAEIKQHAKELIVFPRQAENTSTSRLIQNTVKKHLDQVYSLLEHNR